jgi:RNA polymerase sigma-70 factor (ECF subfamily)
MGVEERLRSALKRGLAGGAVDYREFLSAASGLLRRHIARRLLSMGRTSCDVEDVLQEALLAIHTKILTYDGGAPVTAWIHAIARNKLIDFLRSTTPAGRRLPLTEVENFVGDDGTGFDAALAFGKVLDALPAHLRTPIELTKLRGLSVAETAARTGLSEAAVRVNVHRGLKVMVQMLERPERRRSTNGGLQRAANGSMAWTIRHRTPSRVSAIEFSRDRRATVVCEASIDAETAKR